MAEDKRNAMGMATPEREEAVQPHHPDKAAGERQDSAGAAPSRPDRTDHVVPGSLAEARGGPGQGQGSDDPFAAHRGEPADIRTGATKGSGAGIGGSDVGMSEEPDPDKGGGGRPHQDRR